MCMYIYFGTLWQLTGICIPRILGSTCLDPLRGHGPFQHWSPSTLGNGPLPPAWAHQLCLKAAGAKMKGTAIPPYPDISWDMTHLEPSWTILHHPICLTLPKPIPIISPIISQSSPNHLRSPISPGTFCAAALAAWISSALGPSNFQSSSCSCRICANLGSTCSGHRRHRRIVEETRGDKSWLIFHSLMIGWMSLKCNIVQHSAT